MSSRSRQPANIPYSNFWLVAAEDAVRPQASENRKNYANAVGSKEKRSKRCIMTAKTMSVPAAGKKYFGLGKNGSYNAAKRGEIPVIKIGSRIRAVVVALER